jgi:long-chain acyl-CoA synthetase
MSLNLAVILQESAAREPDKTAVVLDQLHLSYRELDRLTDQVAFNLRSAGVRRGESIGLMLPNVPEFVITYFGILKAGAVVVPMNPLLKAPEVAHYLGDSDARTLITWADSATEALQAVQEVGNVSAYVVNRPGSDSRLEGAQSFQGLLQGADGFEMEETMPDDTAVLLFTSGTTGRPKGAELTHFNLFMNCHISGMHFGVHGTDVVIGVLPLFHAFGQSGVMNIALHFGATLTLLPRFDPAKALELIQRDRVTEISGVPTMFFALLNFPELDRYDTSSLRIASSGGASLPAEVLDAFEKRFGVPILEGYGLSETSPTVTNQSVEQRKPYSIGKPIWGVKVSIFDEQNQKLPAGKENVGEIVIRGHDVMKGYYKDPEATAEAFKGGWFHTGDMGYRDAEGFLFIVDRKKELIIRGGFNVYPREIEEVVFSHPAVAEAAVIGVTDERLGEEVMVVVTLKKDQEATAEEIIGFCKERLASYKYPRSVVFMDKLPKGATGKIQKKELKSMLADASEK